MLDGVLELEEVEELTEFGPLSQLVRSVSRRVKTSSESHILIQATILQRNKKKG